jgi:hypothetical protein
VPSLKRSELELACEDFSNVIGSLSDYMVYKGTLSSGVEIAVVSTTKTSAKGWSKHCETQFRKKVTNRFCLSVCLLLYMNLFFLGSRMTIQSFLLMAIGHRVVSDNKLVPSKPQEFRQPAGLLPGRAALHKDDGVRVRSERHTLRASPR